MICMDPKRCDTFGSIAWVLVIGGLLILAMVFLDIMHTARLDTNVAICALLALGGPLFASIISRIVLRNDQSSENDRYYKIWRIDTLVYLYMMLMACISFAMFIEAGYETSSRETLGRTMAVIYILLMIWLPFLVINCICFLFAVRDHNRTSAVRSNDFYKGLQVILLQIDEMNGVVAPKEKGTKTKFGKKGGKKRDDGVLPIKETNAVDTQQDEKPKMKLRKREKKGGE